MYLSENCNRHSNNLGLLKFIAAVAVIFSHAFSVTRDPLTEPLVLLTREQLTFGGLAVAVFFFASGFYVTKSIMKRGAAGYWKARFIRIYPSFFTVILVTALIVGPAVTTLGLKEYFLHAETYRYFLYLVMIPRYSLPGVFQNNPISTVNGSLWTIILEVLCYFAVFIAYKAKLLDQKILKYLNIPVLAAALVIFGLKPQFLSSYNGYLRPVFIFAAGVEYYVFREKLRLDTKAGAVLALAGLGLCFLRRLDLAMILVFPYLLSLILFSGHQAGRRAADLGNYSYGMYLTAFPIQQIIVHYWPDVNVFCNTLITAVVSFLLAAVLCKWIEAPVLSRVKR